MSDPTDSTPRRHRYVTGLLTAAKWTCSATILAASALQVAEGAAMAWAHLLG